MLLLQDTFRPSGIFRMSPTLTSDEIRQQPSINKSLSARHNWIIKTITDYSEAPWYWSHVSGHIMCRAVCVVSDSRHTGDIRTRHWHGVWVVTSSWPVARVSLRLLRSDTYVTCHLEVCLFNERRVIVNTFFLSFPSFLIWTNTRVWHCVEI